MHKVEAFSMYLVKAPLFHGRIALSNYILMLSGSKMINEMQTQWTNDCLKQAISFFCE